MNEKIKPSGFESDLSEYGPMIYDSCSGEPVAWGFRINNHLGNKFEELRQNYDLECIFPTWFVITKRLTREMAINLYGPETEIERGPRGGFKSITFGTMRFCNKRLSK